MFWMPDQVRHDKLWHFYEIINYMAPHYRITVIKFCQEWHTNQTCKIDRFLFNSLFIGNEV